MSTLGSSPDPLKVGVVGVGYLGRFHALIYSRLAGVELVGVCDTCGERAASIAKEANCTAWDDPLALIGQVDAVSIAVPTTAHREVACAYLEHGIHVLLEKPLAVDAREGAEIVSAAERQGALLQVGHLERFNAGVMALAARIEAPRYIEAQRMGGFVERATDVDVVADLMIHDIDIIQSLVRSPLEKIDASGVGVLTSEIDIANVRLGFANGCVANVTASRVSLKSERKMRFFQRDTYVSVDFQERNLAIFRKGEGEMYPGVPNIASTQYSMDQQDPLREEIAAFLASVRDNTPPLVTGEDGLRALETAIRIGDLLDGQRLG